MTRGTYTRQSVINPDGYHVTEHFLDGHCFAITEAKRTGALVHDPITIDDRRRKLACFHRLVQKGRHDMACYIYLIC